MQTWFHDTKLNLWGLSMEAHKNSHFSINILTHLIRRQPTNLHWCVGIALRTDLQRVKSSTRDRVEAFQFDRQHMRLSDNALKECLEGHVWNKGIPRYLSKSSIWVKPRNSTISSAQLWFTLLEKKFFVLAKFTFWPEPLQKIRCKKNEY